MIAGTGFASLSPATSGGLPATIIYQVGYQMIKYCKKCDCETETNSNGRCKPCERKRAALYVLENKEKVKRRRAEHSALHSKRLIETSTAWKKANTDKSRAQSARYAKNHPEIASNRVRNYRARKHAAGGTHTAQDIKQLFALQRGKCACCKVGINDGYHVDHVIPLSLGGSNDRLNLQLLCPTCNLRKSAKHPIDFMQQQGYLL